MSTITSFSADVLRMDAEAVAQDLETFLRETVFHRLRRKGVVLGLSGGIDSSVVGALAARALGADRVLGLMMPESDSSGDSVMPSLNFDGAASASTRSIALRTVLSPQKPMAVA